MAEPAGSTLTVFTICAQTANELRKLIQTYQDAPHEIQALSNEVVSIQFILNTTTAAIRDGILDAPALAPIFHTARDICIELETLIKPLLSQSKKGKVRTWKLKWLFDREKANGIRERMKSQRDNIQLHVSVITMSKISIVLDKVTIVRNKL
ncbi:hypothetical protein EX30DRAFT_375464 [Ascodesmis nigricans]|uniref:Azaphilone pigments biosynthesis cluster protein L N-terminal domain-containing protein n=1 Tax=Ascodesmis nigricans TaxID=341454 RepID=A0A4S2MHX4_9PEZI|nr:hypothetical protein EX30DRAFT_375464 [Ascodesmis nigricans]